MTSTSALPTAVLLVLLAVDSTNAQDAELGAEVSPAEAPGPQHPRFGGPDAVENQLATDAEPAHPLRERTIFEGFSAWKTRMQEYNGL